jgi:hypothetical protein
MSKISRTLCLFHAPSLASDPDRIPRACTALVLFSLPSGLIIFKASTAFAWVMLRRAYFDRGLDIF